ncbi:hypothetical protein HSX37_06770|nr:hypothetical protein [Dendrosporobacter quercicolus]NSL47745.1 hypothetical protein [Dendrosporobacter quercicolus DSM 1736]
MVDIVLYRGKNRSELMPQINGLENNVLLEICLVRNSLLDVDSSRSDFENWIPFTFLLEVPNEKYIYDEEARTTFTLFEIKRLISEVQNIIHLKKNNQEFEKLEFFNLEANFGIIIFDPFEENELGVEVWIKMGSYSKGQIRGFDKGYSFGVSLISLDKFANELNQELFELMAFE